MRAERKSSVIGLRDYVICSFACMNRSIDIYIGNYLGRLLLLKEHKK